MPGEFAYRVVKTEKYFNLKRDAGAAAALELITALPAECRARALELRRGSHSQILQDVVALCHLDFLEGGFFLEFGAASGDDISNTWMMEKELGWTGILAEPARLWHDELKEKRAAIVDTRCVWRASGERLTFVQARYGEVSGIGDLLPRKRHRRSTSYEVETISLNDLLDEHGAPKVIDFASIDTEGSELEILKAFDFDRYRFRFLAVEHNFTPQREELHTLLSAKGYRRILPEHSQFDDWYVSD